MMILKQLPDVPLKGLVLLIITMAGLAISCNSDQYTPKPRSYARIDMPDRHPVGFRNPDCPCAFDIPSYSEVSMKTTYFMDQPDHPCWFNLNIPYFNGVIHMSYMPVESPEMLERVINDGFKFAFKHTIRADYIDKTEVHIGNVHGVLFDIGGNVASSIQFYATDSTEHFLRGSLYFNQRPNVDSLRPVIEFVREDILAMVRSIDWDPAD